jgi:hypothetical protein
MTQLARWPRDMFFVDSKEGVGSSTTKCTAVFNNNSVATTGWTATNYFCAYTTRADWFYQWSTTGPIINCHPDLPGCINHCIHVTNSAQDKAWNSTYLCWDNRIPFDLTWHENGPQANRACVNWRVRSDPDWNNNNMQICAPLNVPYGPVDSVDSWMYQYRAPIMIAAFPLNGDTSGGTVLTITGTDLSTNGSVTFGNKLCIVVSWPHHSGNILCTIPAGEGASNSVVVNVGGQRSTMSFNFVYNPPFVERISQPSNSFTSGGYGITIFGHNFGTTIGMVTLGSTDCPVTSWMNTEITCSVGGGMGKNATVVVTTLPFTAGQQMSNMDIPFGYTRPIINDVTPKSYSTSGGSMLTISGESFGFGGVVKVGDSACSSTQWMHTKITCELPAGTGIVELSVATGTPDRYQVNDLYQYTYKPPIIDNISPLIGIFGDTLTINGQSFGASHDNPVVMIGNGECSWTSLQYDHTYNLSATFQWR